MDRGSEVRGLLTFMFVAFALGAGIVVGNRVLNALSDTALLVLASVFSTLLVVVASVRLVVFAIIKALEQDDRDEQEKFARWMAFSRGGSRADRPAQQLLPGSDIRPDTAPPWAWHTPVRDTVGEDVEIQ